MSRYLGAAMSRILLCALAASCAGTETRKAEERGDAGSAAPASKESVDAGRAAAQPAWPQTPDAPFRAERPPALPTKLHFDAPVPVERKLPNGARLLVRENRTLPLVAIEVLFGTGINGEPEGKAGLAPFLSSMLTEGTKTRTSLRLAQELEDAAISLSAGAGNETSRVHVNALKETLPKAMEILADVLLHPAFRPEDLERVRGLRIAALTQKRAIPGALASDETARLLYGERHPWGQPSGGTIESVRGIAQKDLRKFHETWYRPNNALISVSGDVSADEIASVLASRLREWKQRPVPKLSLPPFPELSRRSIDALDKPATTQSSVRLVGRLFPATDPDRVPMLVANEVLGGLFTSRLNSNLREKHGYTYGAGSSASLNRTYGTFLAASDIVAQHTADGVREIEAEVSRMAEDGITAPELKTAQETHIRGRPSALETNDSVASALATYTFNGLPLDYFRRVPDLISRVTREDAGRVARKWLHPEHWPVVIVGPVAASEDALQALALGEVRLRAAPGVAEASREPRPAPPGTRGPAAGSVPVPSAKTGRPEETSPPVAPQPPLPGAPSTTGASPVPASPPAARQPDTAGPPPEKVPLPESPPPQPPR
jgi:zinc protease